MTSIFHQNMKRKEQIGSIVGLFASIGGITLWIILIYFNPYSSGGIAEDVMIRTFFGLLLPSIIGTIGSAFRIRWLMYVVFIVSLPLNLYLAGTPGIFKLFLIVSLGYLLSAILISIEKKDNA